MKNVDEPNENTNTEESPRALLATIREDVAAVAGMIAMGGHGALDRDAAVARLADAHDTIAMLADALRADGVS